jgi:hypothetical protein
VRISRSVLREAGGETPPAYSPVGNDHISGLPRKQPAVMNRPSGPGRGSGTGRFNEDSE